MCPHGGANASDVLTCRSGTGRKKMDEGSTCDGLKEEEWNGIGAKAAEPLPAIAAVDKEKV